MDWTDEGAYGSEDGAIFGFEEGAIDWKTELIEERKNYGLEDGAYGGRGSHGLENGAYRGRGSYGLENGAYRGRGSYELEAYRGRRELMKRWEEQAYRKSIWKRKLME